MVSRDADSFEILDDFIAELVQRLSGDVDDNVKEVMKKIEKLSKAEGSKDVLVSCMNKMIKHAETSGSCFFCRKDIDPSEIPKVKKGFDAGAQSSVDQKVAQLRSDIQDKLTCGCIMSAKLVEKIQMICE